MLAPSRLALKLLARGSRVWYRWHEARRAALPAGARPLSILFSHRDAWKQRIRQGFEGVAHRPHFAELRHADLERHDLIVPLSLEDAQYLRQQPGHVRDRMLPLPDAECTALCHDKPALNRALMAEGFADHVPPMGDGIAPPYVCKPMRGENSQQCVLVSDRAAEMRLGASCAGPDLFRQAAVPGRIEYATHFIMCGGRLVRELTVRYHHATALYIKGDADACLETTLGRCPDAATLESMLRSIRYEGLGCANFKIDAKGRLQLIEINPRMGGSLCEHFFSFLRSMPQVWRTRAHGCTNWTWLDSIVERESLGRA